MGGIFLIEYLDDTIQSLTDTQRLVNLPTLAKIGRIDGDKNDNKLVALNSPLLPVVDLFRMLRMNIQSISNWQSLRTILITSAEPSVGKSLTISNLAIVMAQYGNRVILVDADLRKSEIHNLFGIKNEIGLKDLIRNAQMKATTCLQETQLQNLQILTSGSGKISSIEILGSERMKSIIKELSFLADVVLYDSPPALMFTDPFLLGKLINGVIIVSQVGKTRTDLLKRVITDLQMAGINPLGVVIQERKSGEMYSHRYYRHYSEKSKQKMRK